MGWETATLDQVCLFIRNGKSIQQSKEVDGLPITRIETIADQTIDIGRVGYAGLKECDVAGHLLCAGDILLSHINSLEHLGKTALYDGVPSQLVHGMNLLNLRPDPVRVEARYLLYALRSSATKAQILRMANKSVNQASVSAGNLKNLEIPLPPLPEQRRIAAILDKADALRVKRREAIAKLDQLLHSVFLEMFGDPITNPKNWQLHNLAEATFFQEGPGILAKDFRDAGVPLVRLAGINDGKVSLKGCNFVDREMFERKWSQFALSEGDILVLTSATFGKPAVVGKETVGSIFYTGIIRFNSRHAGLSAEFLKAFLASPWFLRQAQKLASGAVIKHFGPTHLKKMHIPIPPMELQQTFARIAENIIRQKSEQRKSINEMDKLFISLQHRAFEGHL